MASFALGAAVASLGCSGDDDGNSATSPSSSSSDRPPTGFELTCSASLTPTEVTYTVDTDSLTVVQPSGTQTLSRVSTGAGGGVYGSWRMPSAPTGNAEAAAAAQLKSTATLTISADKVSIANDCSSRWATLHVDVSSSATITDSSIAILESHAVEKRWTEAAGEETVQQLAHAPVLQAADVAAVRSSAAFPVAR